MQTCIYCGNKSWKKGIKNNTQTYKCKTCKRYFRERYTKKPVEYQRLGDEVVKLNREGVGIRGMARLLGTSPQTILRIIAKKSAEISEQKSKKKL